MATIRDTQFARRLIRDIAPRASIDPGTKRVSFSAGGLFEEQRVLLADLVELNPSIPADDAVSITRDALFVAVGPAGLTIDRYLQKLSELERDYLSRRPERHVLITQVSVDPAVTIPRMSQDGVTISFPQTVPQAFLASRKTIVDSAAHSLYVDPPKNYRWLRASVSAGSFIAAGERALEAIEFRIALMNFGINRSKGFRWSSGKRMPVNSVALAPVHTLHRPSGQLSAETWWYEPGYVTPLKLERGKMQTALDFCAAVVSRLKKLPYGQEFKSWVRYYGRALGEPDRAASYMMLWQALESATVTTHAKYDSTVKRAAFLYDDVDYAKHVLESLRTCRNDLVHRQNAPTQLETRLYILKRYVETALAFHIRHAGDFECAHDAGQFLDMPASTQELDKRLAMVKKAAKFRGLG